jgi:hypothetical protein
MIFKVAVDVTDLVKNAPADSIVTKTALSEIDGCTQAHAEVLGKGLVAPQITSSADFDCTLPHRRAT